MTAPMATDPPPTVRLPATGRRQVAPPQGVSAPAGLPRLLWGVTDHPTDLAAHLRRFGPLQRPGGRRDGRGLLDEVERAGLTGRGGAGFPTARKLAAVSGRGNPVVVVNATEGEPASQKDHLLATRAPHLLIDGTVAAGLAVGATELLICVSRADAAAFDSLAAAASRRPPDEPQVSILAAPHRYVAGEASALARWVGGDEAKPVWGVRPDQRGVQRRPTLVQNAETIAHVALIARFGASWFRTVGTPEEPGSALVTVTGDVAQPGVLEVALGTPLTTVVTQSAPVSTPQALLVGGYGGTWVSASEAAKRSFSRASLAPVGASTGAGLVAVLGNDRCGLAEAARLAFWLSAENAGQCGPCVSGLPAVAEQLRLLAWGGATKRDVSTLRRWLGEIDGRGGCSHPDLTVRMVDSALRVFDSDVRHHLTYGACVHAQRSPLLPTPDLRGIPWR